MMLTRGHVELQKRVSARMKSEKLSQNACARLVECDSGWFSKLMRGVGALPGIALARRIKEEFGVEIEWWDVTARREPSSRKLAANG